MKVNKIYSDNGFQSAANVLTESDFNLVKELVSKYDSYELFDILNEKTLYEESNGRFDTTGGYKDHGIPGAIRSIPSFLITAAISWPVAMLAAIGALHNRIQARWDDKESWRNRLKPGYWAEYLANPVKKSTPHSIVSGAGKAGLLVGGVLLGNLAWPKLKKEYNELKGKAPGWMKKLIGIGAAAGIGSKLLKNDSSIGMDSSINFDKNLELTPEDVKNIDFKQYWLKLSNGEILKVRTDTAENAKKYGVLYIMFATQNNGIYEQLNRNIQNGHIRYTFKFDDGEVCYWAGKNEKEAQSEAKKLRVAICDKFNMTTEIPLEPMDHPDIYETSEQKKGVLIPLPEKDKITVLTTQPEKNKVEKKTLKVPVYNYEGLNDYKIQFMNFIVHFGAKSDSEAKDMVRHFVYNSGYEVIDKIFRNSKSGYDEFSITMGDGDNYKIYANDIYSAKDIATSLHNKKNESMINCASDKNALENFFFEYSNIVNTVKQSSVIQKNKRKPFNESRKASIKLIKKEADDLDTDITSLGSFVL